MVNHSFLNGRSVLLADDEEINGLLVQAILEQAGLQVTIAGNGTEAIAAAGHDLFDIIILDIEMPGVDGLEAFTLLRESGFANPVIAMTAHNSETYRQKCLDHGFSAFIVKPFKGDDLLALIASLIKPTSQA